MYHTHSDAAIPYCPRNEIKQKTIKQHSSSKVERNAVILFSSNLLISPNSTLTKKILSCTI